jgi:CBS domain-containing protein
MTREVIVIRPDFPLGYAWELMRTRHIRHLPVAIEGDLFGMLSDRDVLTWATRAPSGELVVPDVSVRAAMTRPVLTCARGATVSHIARTMTEHKIDALPVVDDEGRLVGIVTSTDLMALLIERKDAQVLPFDFELLTVNQRLQIERCGA